jgi:hypothetical protein
MPVGERYPAVSRHLDIACPTAGDRGHVRAATVGRLSATFGDAFSRANVGALSVRQLAVLVTLRPSQRRVKRPQAVRPGATPSSH